MSAALFHATSKALRLHQPIPAHPRTVTQVQARTDKEFDGIRPSAAIPRFTALFAGNDAAFCAAYLVLETGTAADVIYIYRVEIPAPLGHPMYLSTHAMSFLEDKATLTKIVQEYWTPTHAWKCWEYLATSMTPVAIEPTPDANAIAGARFRYGKDFDLARRLWPIQNSRIMRQF